VTLVAALLVIVLVQSLTAAMLSASAALARLGGDRRAAVEATIALESVLAEARVHHADAIASVAPGQDQALLVAAPPGWTARATASREATGDLLWLRVEVRRVDAAGQVLAGQRGTLILARTTADTALVITTRPQS
jgi:hypothetical protein